MFSKERLINAAIAALVAFLTGIGLVPSFAPAPSNPIMHSVPR